VPHLELVAGFRLDVTDVYAADYCSGWPVAQTCDQLIDRWFFASQMRFHASVSAVANPARNAELIGLLLSPGAEEHTLHSADNANVAADASHHTTLMSGASSAFMPTTL
jgi:hypothetical protein